jgi:PAS domain S-box-containing protein
LEIDRMKDEKKTRKDLINELAGLRERERRLRDFFMNAPVHRFLLLDRSLNIVAGNETVLGLFSGFFGVKKEDLIGRSFPDLVPGFKGSDRHEKYLDVLRTGIPFYTEELAPPPEAGDVRLSVWVFKAGEGIGIIAMDITERVHVEGVLRESEQKYATLVEQAYDGVVILQDGVIKFANPAAEEMVGYSLDEVPGADLTHPVAPECRAEVAEKYRLRMAGETIPPYEAKVLHKDGTVKDVEISAKLTLYEGRPASLSILRDITERKRTEQALQESEERFRALFEGSLDAIFLAEPDSGVVVDANPAASELLLRDLDDMVGLHFTKLFPQRLEAYILEKWTETIEAGEEPTRFEALGLCADGQEVPVEGVAQIIQIDGVPFLYGNFRDIRKHKEAEEFLRRSEERYRIFFDEAPTALWEIDCSYVKEYCDALRQKGIQDPKAYLEEHPDEAARCERKVELVEINRASLQLLEAESKEELLRNLHRVLPKDTTPPFSGGLLAIAEGRTSFEREIRSTTLKGKEKHFLYRWSVLPSYEETYSRLLVSILDITDRVRLEQDLLRTQKLESLGVLAGGIAHDFNNLLTAISTNISMALMYGDLDEDIRDMLGDAEKASSRAKNLTQQLLAFAKGGTPVKKTVSIRRLLDDTVDFALSGSNVRSVCSVPEDLWNVSADEGQIGQVVQNLVINADQAMPGGGEINVSAENVLVEGEELLPLKRGRYAKISVTDQGIGISKKHLNRVFDPFFTTKQKGSGLGLTTCFTIVQNHGGHIRVHSEVDVGTRVDVFLPASEDRVQAGAMAAARPARGEERILLIDDEEMIRTSAGEMLKRFGYEVTIAEDGEEGIRQYREAFQQGLPFHAVILDLTIRGGKGGTETLEEMMRIDPEARVIVSSGYSDDPVMSNYEAYGFRDVITKPYKLEEVSDTLRKVIADGQAEGAMVAGAEGSPRSRG